MKSMLFKSSLLIVLAVFVLAACGPAATPPPAPTAVPPTAVPPTAVPPTAVPPTAVPTAAPVVIRVATDATWPPFESVDEASKKIIGFDIDLLTAAAEKGGFQVEFVNTGWDALLAGISQCQFDAAISSITITDDRKKTMLFSDPYYDAGQVVTVRSSSEDIKSKDDLKGKTAGAQLGTTGEMEIKKVAGAKVKTYDTVDQAYLDLINGQVDAVVADNPLALGFIGKSAGKLKAVGAVFTSEQYGIAVCNKKPEVVAMINKGLAAIKAEGLVEKLNTKWVVGSGS